MLDRYEQIRQVYDDGFAIELHMDRFWRDFMTDFEKKCYQLGLRHLKAFDDDGGWAVFLSGVDEDVREALSEGFEPFLEKVKQRMQSRKLAINRCPACEKVAQTPKAKQCFWCGHDWH